MKTVAIIGAGFVGIAVAWELIQKNYEVHLYDSLGIGGGASGIAAGLLHAFPGAHAKLVEEGQEGITATGKLLEIASQALKKPLAATTGLLRLAVNKEMVANFQESATRNKNLVWLTAEECQKKISGLSALPGLLIPEAITVQSEDYLKGLWLACEQYGPTFIQKNISSLTSLAPYDFLVVAVGAAISTILELKKIPFTAVKGQVLELNWPVDIPPLAMPITGQGYLLMQPNNKFCLAGATYERNFPTTEPDAETAATDILPKMIKLIPTLKNSSVVSCRAALRASTAGHRPLLHQIDSRSWLLTGMGSKGLLYHALYAKRLASFF